MKEKVMMVKEKMKIKVRLDWFAMIESDEF